MENKKNELAELIIDDSQPLRAIHNYLMDTFDGVKHEELFDRTFTDRIRFVEFIQNTVCPAMISALEEWKLDLPEEYESNNQANN
jgi:hypothetical protein